MWTPIAYTACSVTCGVGVQTRNRSCTNPSPAHGGIYCPGEDYDVLDCHAQVCDGRFLENLLAFVYQCSELKRVINLPLVFR